MHLPSTPDRVVARTFPTSDAIFAERVRDVLQQRSEADAEHVCATIETSLRRVYPQVRASVRTDVAGFGDTIVYVFRDGSATAPQMADDWIDDTATARVVTNSSGTYVDANERRRALVRSQRRRDGRHESRKLHASG